MKITRPNSFSFEFQGPTDGRYMICEVCEWNDVKKEYVALINSLKERELLDEDYPYMCCGCWNKAQLIGHLFCPVCGAALVFDWIDHSKKEYAIYCEEDHSHFFFPFFDHEIGEILKEQKYKPNEVLKEEWKKWKLG